MMRANASLIPYKNIKICDVQGVTCNTLQSDL